MAECAVEYLLKMIHRGNKRGIPHLTKLPCEIIIRESCGSLEPAK
jgi:DNA-binding LacI/PurR family transcriptional regulator